MKILKQLLFVMLIVSGGSLIANLSDKEKHDLIYSSGLPTTSIDQIQRNLSRLKEHGHLSAANKVQTILDTRKGAQSADTKSDQQIAATLAKIKQQLELGKKIDQLAHQLEQSKQQPTQVPAQISWPIHFLTLKLTPQEIIQLPDTEMYRLFNLDPESVNNMGYIADHSKEARSASNQLIMKYYPHDDIKDPSVKQATTKAMDKMDAFYKEKVKPRVELAEQIQQTTQVPSKIRWPIRYVTLSLTPQEIIQLPDAEMYRLFNLDPANIYNPGYMVDHSKEVNDAYTQLILKYHPYDEFKDPLVAEEAMDKINDFYRDNIKRQVEK